MAEASNAGVDSFMMVVNDNYYYGLRSLRLAACGSEMKDEEVVERLGYLNLLISLLRLPLNSIKYLHEVLGIDLYTQVII